MDFTVLIDKYGEGTVATLGGLAIGLLFGFFAQRSRFCLRAAVVEFSRGSLGPKMAIWLLAFSAALAGTQGFISAGLLDVSEARQFAARGSLSGAIIGGLMFGAGMILSRGCASRLLVLSATGNLRALMAGLVLTIVAQASLRGVLSPMREWMAGLWTVEAGASRNLMSILGLDYQHAMMVGITFLSFALIIAAYNRISKRIAAASLGVGFMVAVGWFFTYSLSAASFDIASVKSISFTGPSADTLMALINEPELPFGFDLGIVPGVFAGAFIAAIWGRELKLECFGGEKPMPRYMIGAAFMGFGSMLAGGCAVGAGVTGGAVFALTAWVALTAMWLGAGLTDFLIDRGKEEGEAEQLSVQDAHPAE
ncbi:MAG: YeeE/YedE family protein [Rhodospirillales bacterium]|nr:YeeE/YedE family protein [Rhodospirillales bacterium]MCW8862958.1 YeeE/YedE family protein [Rhodospirillales bacterium]